MYVEGGHVDPTNNALRSPTYGQMFELVNHTDILKSHVGPDIGITI